MLTLEQIRREIQDGIYYRQNFSNDGQRFVAWYLRRVMLLDPVAVSQSVTDGPNDNQMDAVVVDDELQRIIIVQGKFVGAREVSEEPLREILGAWLRLQDLESLQKEANERLRERLEAVRQALDDEYEVVFEL